MVLIRRVHKYQILYIKGPRERVSFKAPQNSWPTLEWGEKFNKLEMPKVLLQHSLSHQLVDLSLIHMDALRGTLYLVEVKLIFEIVVFYGVGYYKLLSYPNQYGGRGPKMRG